MTSILFIFIIIPLIGFLISVSLPKKNETALSISAFLTTGTYFLSLVIFFIYWLTLNHPTIDLREVGADISIYKTPHYEFYIDLLFDKITAVYALVGGFLTFLVTVYSRYYMHREKGYKRFFNTILFFFLGYNITIFSGNIETLFIGWEILGISSFLLIAFYRDRYFPVKNAFKVFSIYRVGDVGLLLAMWLSHHLFAQNITFFKLSNYELVHDHITSHSFVGAMIALMILVSAAAKSAQLPFSSWLPRAMEGPTPSSAIFYGSLSVHVGVFLLLRTYPFWENQISVRVIIIILGLATSIIASLIARVQSSVKSQIAYASIAQIGLIFIEVALGFEKIALIHFAGNAFLRTYQLLVSPSVVSYLIREQFYNFVPRTKTIEDSFPKKIEYTFYQLSIKEWNLDKFNYWIWKPLKFAGRAMGGLTVKKAIIIFSITYIIGGICLIFEKSIPTQIYHLFPFAYSLIGFVLVLKSYTERKNVMLSWLLVIMNHFWIALAISFNEHFKLEQTIIYLSGIVVLGTIGILSLNRIQKLEGDINLNQYQGHSYEHPKIALLFLIACLGLTGFPISPTFVGEDLIFSHIHENQIGLAFITSSSLIIDGIATIRIYSRVFLGPHVKTYHETAYKSS